MSVTAVSRPEPCILVIFGATGDLTQRKLYPALINLAAQGRLPEHFAVVAVGRREKTDALVREEAKRAAAAAGAAPAVIAEAEGLLKRLHYFQMDFDVEAAYPSLRSRLAGLDAEYNTQGNRIYFLAVAPQYFGSIADYLYRQGMTANQGAWQRVVVEKPFGRNLPSPGAKCPSNPGLESGGYTDRPLSGQGNAPEFDGNPVRQHPLNPLEWSLSKRSRSY